MPVETIIERPGEPLPDVDELNAAIPQDEWEEGLDGKPRPPWQHQYGVYFLNPMNGVMYTSLNSTFGQRLAFEQLCDRIQYIRAIRGSRVVPLVRLSSKMMKTKFGPKPRPDFKIIEWRELGPSGGLAPVPKQIGKPVAPPTSAEIIDDGLPEW